MAAASLAVDVSPHDGESTLWVRVIAFGRLAGMLEKHGKGDALAASGRLELQHWTAEDNTERESWQLIAETLHSARTVRPGGKGGTQARCNGPAAEALDKARAGADNALPFDDEITF